MIESEINSAQISISVSWLGADWIEDRTLTVDASIEGQRAPIKKLRIARIMSRDLMEHAGYTESPAPRKIGSLTVIDGFDPDMVKDHVLKACFGLGFELSLVGELVKNIITAIRDLGVRSSLEHTPPPITFDAASWSHSREGKYRAPAFIEAKHEQDYENYGAW